jgi:hypothetical protein
MKVVLRAVRSRRARRERTRRRSGDDHDDTASDRPPEQVPGDDVNVFELSSEARVYRL